MGEERDPFAISLLLGLGFNPTGSVENHQKVLSSSRDKVKS